MYEIPKALPAGLVAYARSPDFTPDTLPAKLQSAHSTKHGTWGVLHVLEGRVRYVLEPPHDGSVSVGAGETVIIQDQIPHHVAFEEPGRFFIEFHREQPPHAEGTEA